MDIKMKWNMLPAAEQVKHAINQTPLFWEYATKVLLGEYEQNNANEKIDENINLRDFLRRKS